MRVTAGARDSLLSRVQFQEIVSLFPKIHWTPIFVKTKGDLDKKTSLRSLGSSDFFTKELDDFVLQGKVRVAIHSAKDLPNPMPPGLKIAHLTQCVDPRDSLVLKNATPTLVATSSKRREELVNTVWPNCRFVDLRGTIQERLALLEEGHPQKVDGVVVAEAALIRLQLTHLPRHIFPDVLHPLQGRLAIVVRSDDEIDFS